VIAPPAPAPAPKPAIRKGITPLVKVDPVYPREAIRAGIAKGRVVARLFIDEKGLVSEVRIVESDPPGVFNKEVTRALSQWKFQAEGEKFVGEVELTFTLKDE
jgi:periplasmic protein TonB